MPLTILSWVGSTEVLLPAFWGGVGALVTVSALRLVWRFLFGRYRSRTGAGADECLLDEMRQLERNLHEFAGVVEERLTDRIHRLEKLIRQGDRIVSALNKLEDLRAQDSDPSEREVPRPSDSVSSDLLSFADSSVRSAASSSRPGGGSVVMNKKERVLALADSGSAPEDIAEELHLMRGEVDLILSLHRSARHPD